MGDSNHDHSDSAGQGQSLTRYIAVLNSQQAVNFCQSLKKGIPNQFLLLYSTRLSWQNFQSQIESFLVAQRNFDYNWLHQRRQILFNLLNQICNAIWVQYRLQSLVAEQVNWIILQQYALVAGDTS